MSAKTDRRLRLLSGWACITFAFMLLFALFLGVDDHTKNIIIIMSAALALSKGAIAVTNENEI